MADGTAAAVDAAIRAAGVTSLIGVSIGNPADKTTWRVQLADNAPGSDATTAATAIAAIDLTTLPQTVADQEAGAQAMQKIVKALVAYVYRVTHSNTNPTNQQLQQELQVLKAIFKNLP